MFDSRLGTVLPMLLVSESKAVKHSHLPNHKQEFQIRKVQQKIKTAARDTEETTIQIILNAGNPVIIT